MYDFLPPLDTPGLTPAERTTLRVASTLVRNDALDALGISPASYRDRMNNIRIKYRDWQNRELFTFPLGSGAPSVGGILTRGFSGRGYSRPGKR
jgi:hypothetical protein